MSTQNYAPGVYSQVIDQSFTPTEVSRFRPGLVGVAEKGPFNTPVIVRSDADFIRNFGNRIPGTFLASAAVMFAQFTDTMAIVRVGREYESVASAISGTAGSNTVAVSSANLFTVGDYARISQRGRQTTVNAVVAAVNSGSIELEAGSELADTYTNAEIDRSPVINAANEAEGFLSAYVYGSALEDTGIALTLAANKNAFEGQISGVAGTVDAQTIIAPGDILKITQSGKNTTREILVKEVRADNTIKFETANRSDIGYEAIALQDSYTAGVSGSRIAKVSGYTYTTSGGKLVALTTVPETTSNVVHIVASSSGTWANSTSARTGVLVEVGPGSTPDTKKFTVYWNGTLTEVIDGLVFGDSSSANYVETVVNAQSELINVTVVDGAEPPASTRNPWNTTATPVINRTGLSGGFNGENAAVADFIGTIDASTDQGTGLKALEDPEAVDINFIAAPGRVDVAIHQEIARITAARQAYGVLAAPAGLNGREALDWHNGEGVYSGNGRIDNAYAGVYYNWFDAVDYFTGDVISLPPDIGALRAFGFTHKNAKPWLAAAGLTRGRIPEALDVEFRRIPLSTRNAFAAPGNAINPILNDREGIVVFGERTLQRSNSKLSSAHNVILINYCQYNLSQIGRRYNFDPIDDELLEALRSSYVNFLDGIRNERGLEGFNVVVDSSNNPASLRNNRAVRVDYYIIPTDTMERLYINAIVRSSGASLEGIN